MKAIGFIGGDSADIVVYLARLINAAGSRAAIVDCTRGRSLMRTVSLPAELVKENGYYKEVLILCGENDNRKDLDAQELAFYYFENETDSPLIKECTELVLVSDMIVSHAQLFWGMELPNIPKAFLIRNAVPLKYNETYLAGQTGQMLLPEDIFVIAYDERDYVSRCYLCIDRTHKLTGLSYNMKKILSELLARFMGKKYARKELAQLWKAA